MARDDSWDELIARLEDDLRNRARGEHPGARLHDPWKDVLIRLRRLARSIANPVDAEDAVQTVLLKMQSMMVLRLIKSSRSPKAYLLISIRNAALDSMRRRARELTELQEESGLTPHPEELLHSKTWKRAVERVVVELPEQDQRLLRLRFWDGVSMADIASREGLSYSAVAVRMFRLLRRLRASLAQFEPAQP